MKIEKDWCTNAGLRAVVVMTALGHRCGYVRVGENHPLSGVNYNESSPAVSSDVLKEDQGKRGIMALLGAALADDKSQLNLDVIFDVHGSLTYSGHGPLNDDDWWFGFDAGHFNDAPELDAIEDPRLREIHGRLHTDGVVRTLDYMVDECESLAKQLIDRCAV